MANEIFKRSFHASVSVSKSQYKIKQFTTVFLFCLFIYFIICRLPNKYYSTNITKGSHAETSATATLRIANINCFDSMVITNFSQSGEGRGQMDTMALFSWEDMFVLCPSMPLRLKLITTTASVVIDI